MYREPSMRPAVRYRGLWYSSDCCHHCAMEMAAFSEGVPVDQLKEEEDFQVGYETEGGEFITETGDD